MVKSVRPVSSRASRSAAAIGVSSGSTVPAGTWMLPAECSKSSRS
jgi:hypothetical protein